jgi:ABC-type thiamine transport system substrate-binding protein
MRRTSFVALCFTFTIGFAQADELSLYCSNLEAQCRLVAAGFERATGVKVLMVRKSTGEVYAQLKAEAMNPRGDVWWGGTSETHLQAATEGLLEKYQSPGLSSLHPGFSGAPRLLVSSQRASTSARSELVSIPINYDARASPPQGAGRI